MPEATARSATSHPGTAEGAWGEMPGTVGLVAWGERGPVDGGMGPSRLGASRCSSGCFGARLVQNLRIPPHAAERFMCATAPTDCRAPRHAYARENLQFKGVWLSRAK